MLCQCWSYFFHWSNIDKMSNILILYQCHFKTCCYNVTLTSYQWLYQHWTLNILLRCCKSTHTKRGQVCDGELQDLGAEYLEQLLMSSSCCELEIEMSDINLLSAITNPRIANCHVDNSEFFSDLLLPNLVVLSKLLLHIDRVVCTPHDFFDATGSIFPPELGN